MKAVLQRVAKSAVTIDKRVKSTINVGLLVFIGIEDADNEEDIKWLSNKIVNLRIFDDENTVPNVSIKDINGDILLVRISMTENGDPPESTIAERVNGILKEEYLNHYQTDNLPETKKNKKGYHSL